MGKAEKGTPKDLANRMKAKGLQKLRWYCQMCQKQCRDENGFKCHTTSEAHQRQLLLFAENPDKYLDSFSEEFYDGYMSLLKRRFGTKRVHSNNVYQEYIHDKDHVHMNSTQWETLTEFVKWLGKEGHCIVDETEKGWYVAYVDRDPETLMRQQQKDKREKFEKDEEERFQEFINRQVELGKKNDKNKEEFTELKRESEDASISLNMKVFSKPKEVPKTTKEVGINPLKQLSGQEKKDKLKKESATKKRSVLEDIIEEDMQRKKRYNRNETSSSANTEVPMKAEPSWITKNIVVKVITKELGSKYYKEKGVIREVVDRYAAIVKLNEFGIKLKLDQAHLETVIPNVGREVLILLGKYKGLKGILKSLEEEKFCATVEIISKPYSNKLVTGIPYEHFSKLYSEK